MRFATQGSRALQFSLAFGVSVFLVAMNQACAGAAPPTRSAGPALSRDAGGVAPLGSVEPPSDGLFAFAREYAASKGYRFGSGADVMLRNATAQANQEITGLSAYEREVRTAEAKKNIARFIDAMIAASHEIPGYSEQSPGVIGEQTFEMARRRLCPLWPICR